MTAGKSAFGSPASMPKRAASRIAVHAPGGRDQRLGGHAAGVQAVAAHPVLLDEHDGDAERGGRGGHGQAGRARADHADVGGKDFAHTTVSLARAGPYVDCDARRAREPAARAITPSSAKAEQKLARQRRPAGIERRPQALAEIGEHKGRRARSRSRSRRHRGRAACRRAPRRDSPARTGRAARGGGRGDS